MSKKITKDMTLWDIVNQNPEAAEVMLKKGLHCIGCGVAKFETLEQGALAHGLSEKEVEEMVEEINQKINAKKEK